MLPQNSAERRLLEWIHHHRDKRISASFKVIEALKKEGWVSIEDRMRRRRLGPQLRTFIQAKEERHVRDVLKGERTALRAKNEREFLGLFSDGDPIMLTKINHRFSNGSYLVKKWEKAGLLERFQSPVYRDPGGEVLFPTPVPSKLFAQQKRAHEAIGVALEKGEFSTHLLYGVTGSGKTEVYYKAIRHTIDLGRQALLMVPEIALAGYLEGIFRSRLGKKLAIYHSGLSKRERYGEWTRMVKGEVDLAIGARSALFAPLPRLGLIIVDEEHDFSFKQEEGPRYQARDAAVVRGKIEDAVVVLGTGTPSVQTYHNAKRGRYGLISMPTRVEKRPLPKIQIVDMKKASSGRGGEGILSEGMKEAIQRNLEEERQSIIFLNRRGFHRVYLCRSCGKALTCPNCDVTLIYHKGDNRLACHYCGFYSERRERCNACGQNRLKAYGFGTERLEKELSDIFPEARVGRMDRDSTRRKGYATKILKRFNEQEMDILVGTQMVTKGYHFPNVTLVGVIAADLSLGFPDFRAAERTFHLLSQVAGRAGRGDHPGTVIIQTFNPEHYAIRSAKDHDHESFFNNEKELRFQLGYPPFSHLACLRFQGNSKKLTESMSHHLSRKLHGILTSRRKRGEAIQILGPVEAPMSKLKGKFRWQILIKSKSVQNLHLFLREVDHMKARLLKGSGVNLVIDVDPYQML
jgi:primosomal protein N' (replication factor Y)